LPLVHLGIRINDTNSHISVRELLIGTGSEEYKTRTADLVVGSVTVIDTHYNDSDVLQGRNFLPDEQCTKCKSCSIKRKVSQKENLARINFKS